MKFMLDFLILVRYLLPPSQHIFMCGRVREALWRHHGRDEAQGCRQQEWLSSGENGSRVSVWVALLLVKITVHSMAKVQCEIWKAAAYKAEWQLLGKGGVGVRRVGYEEQGPLLKLRNLWSIWESAGSHRPSSTASMVLAEEQAVCGGTGTTHQDERRGGGGSLVFLYHLGAFLLLPFFEVFLTDHFLSCPPTTQAFHSLCTNQRVLVFSIQGKLQQDSLSEHLNNNLQAASRQGSAATMLGVPRDPALCWQPDWMCNFTTGDLRCEYIQLSTHFFSIQNKKESVVGELEINPEDHPQTCLKRELLKNTMETGKGKDDWVLHAAFKVLGADTFIIHSKTAAKIFKAQK